MTQDSIHAAPKAGKSIRPSRWVRIDQTMIDQFGAITFDPDPMHIDAEWARENGPYGGTIAFGFLTLSLLTHFLHDAMNSSPESELRQPGHFLNYGFNRVRFITPVRSNERVRGHFRIKDSVSDEQGRLMTCVHCEIEIEGRDRPALVAEWLSLQVPPEAI
ncbi:MAG: MaoC family dehydratase [Pseudomonadota bacterium]